MIYKAEYDERNNYNDAPDSCDPCGHAYFRISSTSWICDACGSHNPPDKARTERYRIVREHLRALRMKRKKNKVEAMDFDGLF